MFQFVLLYYDSGNHIVGKKTIMYNFPASLEARKKMYNVSVCVVFWLMQSHCWKDDYYLRILSLVRRSGKSI